MKHNLPISLEILIKEEIDYNFENDDFELKNFMEKLSRKAKNNIIQLIYMAKFKKIKFL